MPEQAAQENPLLAVLWARFQESCRLLHTSGEPCVFRLSAVVPWPVCKACAHSAYVQMKIINAIAWVVYACQLNLFSKGCPVCKHPVCTRPGKHGIAEIALAHSSLFPSASASVMMMSTETIMSSAGLALGGELDRAAAEEDARIRAKTRSSTEQGRPMVQRAKRRRIDSSSSSEPGTSSEDR